MVCCRNVSPGAGNRGTVARLRESPARRTYSIALVTAVAFVAVAILSHVDLADSDQPRLPRATVAIASSATTRPVPRSYLGLSTEYWALPLYASRLRLFEHAVSLLHVPGDGPLVLRVGGDSADRTFWDPRREALPAWAYPITTSWASLLAKVVRQLRLRVIIDLNLITSSPTLAAALAGAAEAQLPHKSIIGFEVGNEPDIYRRTAWVAETADRLVVDPGLPAALTPADYVADFRAYAAALHAVAPGVPLVGPALANPRAHERWIATLVADRPPSLATVSAHSYVYSGCVHRRSSRYPTIARLLSQRATAGIAAGLAADIRAAHRAGLPFRLSELNSVNCGGRPGVSDAFATALWAPEALFDLLRAGVDSVNIHTRADMVNAPFAVNSSGFVARPLLYGLITFVRSLGSRPRLVPLRLRARSSLRLHAWAVESGDNRLNVLLVNDGRRDVRVRLDAPTHGPASIQRLLARSPRALSGVTLDGQWLGHDGRWHGARSSETVTPWRRGYLVIVPRYSAAIVTGALNPGALTREREPAV
jgi:hypothetical protein